MLNDLVTVLIRPYPQQLYIIRSRLEAEGIECFIKDELTVQSNNLWSNAVGGVKLQVQKQDVERAIAILTELGYIDDKWPQEDNIFTIIDKKTASIPIVRNFNSSNRVVIIILLLIFLAAAISYFITRPSKLDMLTKQSWVVTKIYFKNKPINPKTIEVVSLPGNRNIDYSQFGEQIIFNNNSLYLPGINSRIIQGTWKFNGTKMVLKVDTLNDIFDGSYDVKISNRQLTLSSTTTIIIANEGM